MGQRKEFRLQQPTKILLMYVCEEIERERERDAIMEWRDIAQKTQEKRR
jgi:hypothetical protein